MSRRCRAPRDFFASGHGKGPVDALGGRLMAYRFLAACKAALFAVAAYVSAIREECSRHAKGQERYLCRKQDVNSADANALIET